MIEKTLSKAAIQREREALNKRLADLDVAERVLDSLTPVHIEPIPAGDLMQAMPSIKHLIIFAANMPQGADVSEITEVIRAWKPGYLTTNVSPKLSLYRAAGYLDLKNGRWFATEKGRKDLEKSKD
jgi:hypothetical protein